MKHLFFVLSPIFFISFDSPKLPNEPDLKCILSASKLVYKKGQIPDLKIEIKNTSNSEIYLIGSLDGSEYKLRRPFAYFTIEKPKPDLIKVGLCGTTNPIRLNDIQKVNPGESFDPYKSIDDGGFFTSQTVTDIRTFKNPGIYKIQFHYSTASGNFNDYKGSSDRINDSALIKRFFSLIPKIEIVSNKLEIRIER